MFLADMRVGRACILCWRVVPVHSVHVLHGRLAWCRRVPLVIFDGQRVPGLRIRCASSVLPSLLVHCARALCAGCVVGWLNGCVPLANMFFSFLVVVRMPLAFAFDRRVGACLASLMVHCARAVRAVWLGCPCSSEVHTFLSRFPQMTFAFLDIVETLFAPSLRQARGAPVSRFGCARCGSPTVSTTPPPLPCPRCLGRRPEASIAESTIFDSTIFESSSQLQRTRPSITTRASSIASPRPRPRGLSRGQNLEGPRLMIINLDFNV